MKEQIKQYFPFVTWSILFGLIWMLAEYKTESKHVQFSEPEMKVQTEYHVKSVDPVQAVKNRFKDSIAEAKHRAFQDSIDMVRDTLSKRNAVTIFQMKDELDKKNKRDSVFIQKVLDHLDEHDQ